MIPIAVVSALYLLVVGPVLAACLSAIRREKPESLERAVADVQNFIDLRERAHAELATTGSLDRFIAIKNEARLTLTRCDGWRTSAEFCGRKGSEMETMPNERTNDARAELQSWYRDGLQPKLARAASRGAVDPRQLPRSTPRYEAFWTSTVRIVDSNRR